jgi:hypothetical protein
MIPEFNHNGNLPNGIHLTTIEEIEERFGYNLKRKKLITGLKKLINDFKEKTDCTQLFIDGSFVTNKLLPNDIDVCWASDGELDYETIEIKMPILFDFQNGRRNQQNEYSCDIFPAYLIEQGSQKLFIDFFQIDKITNERKGILQINL